MSSFVIAVAAFAVALGAVAIRGHLRERSVLRRLAAAGRERDAALAGTRRAERQFRQTFDEAPTGMALVGLDGRFAKVNCALGAIVGYEPQELTGLAVRALIHPDDRIRATGLDRLAAGEIESYEAEKRYLHVTGAPVWVSVHATLARDEDGVAQHFVLQVLDVTERRQFEQQLRHMADHDPLTGLLNRRAFKRELERHVAHVKRYGAEGAVLVLDLDHFKYVNDRLGHSAGDRLILAIAHSLQDRLRESDILARLGGDEFALLLPKADRGEAEIVAEALLARVEAEAVSGPTGPSRHVSTSIGIALFGDDGEPSGEEMLINADLAMYEAKEQGRARYTFYSGDDHEAPGMKSRVDWAERLQVAIQTGAFELLVQPILDLSTGEIAQHEALLRMRGDDGDLIPPGAFLEVAERFDLIQHIDRWVARRAIELIAEMRAHGREITLEVNVSGRSMGDPLLLETIERELRRYAVEPSQLVLEVTETAAVANIGEAREFAERLAELGCRFALDDFGAGFGSFYYLKHLPFDYLKIDGEFIRNACSSQTDQLIIAAVVQIATGLGKRTIAEFVGDDATIDLLRSHGVDFAQGFHIGKPGPVGDLLVPLQA